MNLYYILDHMITAEQRQAIIKHYTEKDMKDYEYLTCACCGAKLKVEEPCTNPDCGDVMDGVMGDEEDMVNRPSHYNYGDIECIDAIRAMLGEEGFVSYCKGNALKYTWRAGLKSNEEEDLKKAAWYNRMAAGDDPRE